MQVDHIVGIAGGAFFFINGILLFIAVRRGRELCRRVEERFPDQYAELGRPLPGYFTTVRRSAYFRLIMKREFAHVSDPSLVKDFAELRTFEVRQLVFLIGGFAAFGLAFLWLRFGG